MSPERRSDHSRRSVPDPLRSFYQSGVRPGRHVRRGRGTVPQQQRSSEDHPMTRRSPIRPRLLFGGAALLAALALPASTLAATVNGTAGNDHLVGTVERGHDQRLRRQRLDRGPGRQRQDLRWRRVGRDLRRRRQRLDLGRRRRGPDPRRRWRRHHLRWQRRGRDLRRAGRDIVYGGYGNDVIHVGGDNTPDAVHCGPGWDVVYLGRYDIADSELRAGDPNAREGLIPEVASPPQP